MNPFRKSLYRLPIRGGTVSIRSALDAVLWILHTGAH
jgi:hypothetical protein